MIKPVAEIYSDTEHNSRLKWCSGYYEEQPAAGTKLYAIPEGYHIVAIDHDQEMLDNIEQHNDKVREGRDE